MAVSSAWIWRTTRLINQTSSVIRRSARGRASQQVRRRLYSSDAAHEQPSASSDVPWAIGAVVVTVPALTYILWPKPKASHGHGHGAHEEHGGNEGHAEHNSESENEGEDTEGGDAHTEGDESSEESDGGADGKIGEESGEIGEVAHEAEEDEGRGAVEDGEGKEDSSGEGEQGQITPESSDDEQPGTVSNLEEATEGHKEVQFKGPTKDGPPSDYRTSYPDSKGFKKKRIESNYGKPQGPADGEDAFDYDSDSITDKAAASKPAGDQTTMSGKQQGVSNTDTKHSTDILTDPSKPKKAEGQPESAKLKGTIDPRRPGK